MCWSIVAYSIELHFNYSGTTDVIYRQERITPNSATETAPNSATETAKTPPLRQRQTMTTHKMVILLSNGDPQTVLLCWWSFVVVVRALNKV